MPSHRRASRAEFKEREQEKRYGANNKNGTKRPERRRHEAKRPRSIQRDSQNNRGQKNDRRPHQGQQQTDVCRDRNNGNPRQNAYREDCVR